MRKGLFVIILIVVLLCTNGVQFAIVHHINKASADELNTQISDLSAQLAKYTPEITVYTPALELSAGQQFTQESLSPMQIPSIFAQPTYITDLSQIVGKYAKVALKHGTPVTNDLVMTTPLDDTTREVDITANRWNVGLKEGDFIDYRITLPYGEDYIVLSHLRVMQIVNNVIKVQLNESEIHRLNAALVDYYLHKHQGTDVYLLKYVEPGVQKPAVPYYAVPSNIEAVMQSDPNIINKAQATIFADSRYSIDAALAKPALPTDIQEQNSAEILSESRIENNAAIMGDVIVHKEQEKKKQEEDAKAAATAAEQGSYAPVN
jgi:hypothetical protein